MSDGKVLQDILYASRSVKRAQDWASSPGAEYWLHAALLAQGVGTFSEGLLAATNNGWTNTGTIIGVSGSGADFLSKADEQHPSYIAIDTAGDLLQSPPVFGTYAHALQAALCMGGLQLPSKLIAHFYAQFEANNAETASGIGFAEDGGSIAVANDHLATITCNATQFVLRSGAASANLKAVDTNWHLFGIVLDSLTGKAYGYIDDMATALGSIDIEGDEFPVSFGAGVLASTGANFQKLAWARIRYEA